MSKLRSSLLRKKAAAALDQTCINTWMDSGEEEKKKGDYFRWSPHSALECFCWATGD